MLSMKILQIGRARDNDIVVDDSAASKHHAQLVIGENDEIRIIDLNSTNGVWVNGQRISGQQRLELNDIVKLGSYLLPWQTYAREFKAEPIPALPKQGPSQPKSNVAGPHEGYYPPAPMQVPPITVNIQPPVRRNSTALKAILWIGGIVLILGFLGVAISKFTGRSLGSMANLTNTYDLVVNCSEVQNILISSMVMFDNGISGSTSVAPNRGCSPVCVRISISSCAVFAA